MNAMQISLPKANRAGLRNHKPPLTEFAEHQMLSDVFLAVYDGCAFGIRERHSRSSLSFFTFVPYLYNGKKCKYLF